LGVWLSRSGPARVSGAPAQPPIPPAGKSAKPQAAPTKQKPAPAPAAAPSAATVAGPDAVINGSMQGSDDDDGLAGWFIHERFKPQAQVIVENGNRFLRLTNDDASRTVFADQTIKVDPSWKAVTVSARMRASNFQLGKVASQDGREAFAFHDAGGTRVGNWPPVPRVQKDTPWITRSVTVDVPSGAKTIYMQLAIFNATGTVDFDDVSVVPQTAAGAAASASAAAPLAQDAPQADAQSAAAQSAAAHVQTVPGAEIIANGNMEALDARGRPAAW